MTQYACKLKYLKYLNYIKMYNMMVIMIHNTVYVINKRNLRKQRDRNPFYFNYHDVIINQPRL